MAANKVFTDAPEVIDENDEVIRVEQLLALQKSTFLAAPYPSAEQRIGDLLSLKSALLNHKDELLAGLSSDYLYRSTDDSTLADFMPVISAINYQLKHIRRWMKPSKRSVNAIVQPAKAYVHYQPLGVVGIICPWNYPLFLSLVPLVTALSAGNRVMIKMSDLTPATNHALKEILLTIFDEDQVAVIQGGTRVAECFSGQAFNHILFTGSTHVGKKVMRAAADNLTPVTLELGGKSPTIIADDIEVEVAVQRFIFGKTLNAGQTCISPDYILCPEEKVEALIAACRKQYSKMYASVADNPDHTGIINYQHFNRLKGYLADAKEKGARLIPLSDEPNEQLSLRGKIPLTIITGVTDQMTVMQEEVFGPILPIVTYKQLTDAISYINNRPRPLALYLCSFDKTVQQLIIEKTHAGGMCINEAVMHVIVEELPFGGIGNSGMGHYHGYEGFLTFSHAKSMLVKGKVSFAHYAFPPFGKFIHQLISRLFIR